MGFTVQGKNYILSQLISPEPPTLYIGVGAGPVAFIDTQVDLQGHPTLGVARKVMDAGYPKWENDQLICQTTFNPDEATFDWHEVGLFNALTEGVMILREVEGITERAANRRAVIRLVIAVRGS